MFDYFKQKRQQERWFAKGVRIAALHHQMVADVPAAAYLFARTLHNARDLIDDPALSVTQKIARVDDELRASEATNNVDAGICVLALRFIRMLISAQKRVDAGSLALSAAFGEIAPRGTRYRDLDERDFVPPTNEDARRILNNGGNKCIADLVKTVRAETAAAGASVSSADDDVWSLVAMFDVRHEAASGRLAGLLKVLEETVS